MIINRGNLSTLYTGFKASFQGGLAEAGSDWSNVATRVTSTTATEEYGWLGKIPNVREWIGDRVVQNLKLHDYTIKNRTWEMTLGVDRENIEDDNIGIYGPMFQEMGRSAGSFWDQLVWPMMNLGFATTCYDGQYFFDADHPVLDANGNVVSVANTDGGAGTPWYLIDDTRALRPILLQVRKPFDFVSKADPSDDNVFWQKEFVYGTDGRANVGYGFWQFAWGSKQTLNAANYATARAALSGMKGDYGRPLGLRPSLLVVPPALEQAARKLLVSATTATGETNEWQGTARLLVTPWLA